MKNYLVSLIFVFSPLSLASDASKVEINNNKWKVVNFWAEWCGPCRKEIPELNALSIDIPEKSLQVLGVNFDDNPHPKTLMIAKKMGIEFSILTVEQVEQLNLQYPVVLPSTYILSPDNKLIEVLVGEQTKDSLIKILTKLDVKI